MARHSARGRGSPPPISDFLPGRSLSRSTNRRLARIAGSAKCAARRYWSGLLVRITEEKRVDQLPKVMEDNPLKAVLVEKVTDCEFQFLANAYSNQDQTAWALGCKKSESGRKMAEAARGRIKP